MFEQTCRKNLIKIAQAYASYRGISLATVSSEIYGNPRFLSDFKAGKQSASIKTVDKLLGKFRRVWPDDLLWPWLPVIFMGQKPD